MPVISTNLAANSAVRYLNINSSEQTTSLSKLASGSRITQASDDAAGLAISTKISSDITALTQAATNASHGVSVLQTADGGASNISDILQRMKALASQAASGTVTDTERTYIEAEFSQLIEEVDGIATGTRYNSQSLLDGTSAFGDGVSVMVGSDATDTVDVTIATLTSEALGLSTSAGETDSGTDATSGTATGTASISTTGTTIGSTDDVLSIAINGGASTTVTFSASTAYTADQILSTINGAISGATASWSDSGNLLITSDATGTSSTVSLSSSLGTSSTILGSGTVTTTTGDVATAATLTGTSSGYTVTGDDVSFDVNGTTVTLSATGGDGSGVYDTDALVDAINDALTADGNTAVTASNVSGALTLTSSATGADTSVTVDNFDGITEADLGVDGVATDVEADTLSVSTQDEATAALDVIDAALDVVSKARASIGALESRFAFRSESIATSIENLEAANSAIVDTDIASESAKLASAKVKTQAAVASAAQASEMPQDLLKLLQ